MNQRQILRAAHQLAAATLQVALDNGELADIIAGDLDPADAAAVLAAVGRLAERHATRDA